MKIHVRTKNNEVEKVATALNLLAEIVTKNNIKLQGLELKNGELQAVVNFTDFSNLTYTLGDDYIEIIAHTTGDELVKQHDGISFICFREKISTIERLSNYKKRNTKQMELV